MGAGLGDLGPDAGELEGTGEGEGSGDGTAGEAGFTSAKFGRGGELLGPIGAGVIAGEMEGAGLAPGIDEVRVGANFGAAGG